MGNRSILVVAAHPDDEALGCGGTIARHVRQGDQVHVLIFTDGATGVRGFEPDRKWRSGLEIPHEATGTYGAPAWRNAHAAAYVLGVFSLRVMGFPDTRFETLPILDFAHEIEEALHRHAPAVVYTHHGGDLNMDHRWVHQAVVAATRPKPSSTVREVYFWETPSSTEWAMGSFDPFRPTVFLPLTEDDWQRKQQVLSTVYGAEMRSDGHPRSIPAVRALAVLRGAMCGRPLAESFAVGRIVSDGA